MILSSKRRAAFNLKKDAFTTDMPITDELDVLGGYPKNSDDNPNKREREF
jgi:hypothetical protein